MTEIFGKPSEARRAVISAYEDDYKRADVLWRALEAKAQATIPVAGIFAGFALNYAKELQAETHLLIRIATVITVVLLAASVVFAGLAVWVREVLSAPGGQFYSELAEDYAQLTSVAERREYLPALEKNLMLEWQKAAAGLQKANERKAGHVAWSQGLLLGAIVAAAVLSAATAVFPKQASKPGPQPAPVIYEMHQERMRQ